MKVIACLIFIVLSFKWSSWAMAEDLLSGTTDDVDPPVSDPDKEEREANSEIGIEVGALIIIGADFRISYRRLDSPWQFGLRYLDTEDDFVNEGAVGLPNDESDRELRNTAGVFMNYLFDPSDKGSFYVSAALYKTELELQCGGESASDSGSGVYFGGGYRRFWSDHVGFKLGLLVSPFVDLEAATPFCSTTSNSDIDLDVSLVFRF